MKYKTKREILRGFFSLVFMLFLVCAIGYLSWALTILGYFAKYIVNGQASMELKFMYFIIFMLTIERVLVFAYRYLGQLSNNIAKILLNHRKDRRAEKWIK